MFLCLCVLPHRQLVKDSEWRNEWIESLLPYRQLRLGLEVRLRNDEHKPTEKVDKVHGRAIAIVYNLFKD